MDLGFSTKILSPRCPIQSLPSVLVQSPLSIQVALLLWMLHRDGQWWAKDLSSLSLLPSVTFFPVNLIVVCIRIENYQEHEPIDQEYVLIKEDNCKSCSQKSDKFPEDQVKFRPQKGQYVWLGNINMLDNGDDVVLPNIKSKIELQFHVRLTVLCDMLMLIFGIVPRKWTQEYQGEFFKILLPGQRLRSKNRHISRKQFLRQSPG